MRLLHSLLIAAVLGSTVPGQARSGVLSPSDRALLNRALAAYDKGDPAALPLLRQVLAHAPANFEANEALGLTYAESANYGAALPYLENAAHAEPGRPEARANLGAAYLKLDRNKEAARELAAAAALDPKGGLAEANLGKALVKAGRPAEAARAFAASANLTAAPDSDLLYDWALALYNGGAFANASDVLARIPEAARNNQAESLYGDVEERLGRYQAAVEHLRRAAELSGSEDDVYGLGAELLRHWTWKAAAEIFRYGLERYPASDRMAEGLGIANYGDGSYAAAVGNFSALLAKVPSNPQYADLLGRSCEKITEPGLAGCALLQSYADAHPGNAQTLIYAATNIVHFPLSEQDVPRATRLLEQAIRDDPKASEAYYQMGLLDQQATHWKESAAHLEQAVALRPAFASAHYKLALAYFHLGDRERGNAELALRQKYDSQEKAALDGRLRDLTLFVIEEH